MGMASAASPLQRQEANLILGRMWSLSCAGRTSPSVDSASLYNVVVEITDIG